MSIEHKAYVFDTKNFNKELRKIILISGNTKNQSLLKNFINSKIGVVKSPYSGDLINIGWEKELENGDIQELADFAITCYYSPGEEMGISYAWDAVLTTLNRLPLKFNSDYYILGNTLETEIFKLDPGGMGLGFINAEDIPKMYNELNNLKEDFIEKSSLISSEVAAI